MRNKATISLLIVFVVSLLSFNSVSAQTDTQALITQLQEQIKLLQAQVEQIRAELETTKTELEEVKAEIRFTKILRKGMTGDEVRQLQEFFKSFSGVYPEGLVTGYFGPATERAVKRFQEQNAQEILNPLGLKEATGIVGKSTIAKLNELAQGAIPATPAIPAQPSPGEGIPAIPAAPAIPAVPNKLATTTPTVTPSSITVLYPNGGEQWQKGTTQLIKWNSTNVSTVYIKLRKGNDTYSGAEGTITTTTANAYYFQWTVPTTLPDGSDYAIRVIDGNGNVLDDSDGQFSIVSIIPVPIVSPAPVSTPSPFPSPSPSLSPSPSPTPSPSPIATTTMSTTSTASYPGFYMSTDKQSYTKGETIYLTIRRADGGSYAYYVDLYAIRPWEDSTTKVLLQSNLNVSALSGITPQINTATIEPFKSGISGTYLLLVCGWGQECVGGVNTNSMGINFSSAAVSATSTAATVTVISPNGGESWTIGSHYFIQWSAPSNAAIRLDLMDSSGGLAMYNLVNIAGSPGIAEWQIPSYTSPGRYLVKVIACVGSTCDTGFVNVPTPTACNTSSCYNDSSDNLFDILSATSSSTDIAPPKIYSVAVASTTSNSATITWTTDELSDSQVHYGLTSSYNNTMSLDAPLSTSHSVLIPNLTSNTTYHYKVSSADSSTNRSESGDQTFTTAPAIAMTIKGRVVNGLSGEPVANSNMFLWNWKGSARRDFYINSDGTFSINLTADDIANASAMYVNYVYVNGNACYDQSRFVINKTTSNSISYIAVNGPGGYQSIAGIVNRTVQPTGTETDIGDLLVWPVTGFNLVSDIPVRFNGYFENGSGGAGNTNYQTSHGFSTFYPIEINTKITLTDQSGNQYNSSYIKYSLSQHCSQVTLNFSNGQFSWSPPGIISGSATATTSPALILENISSQLASIAEAVSRLMQEIKNLIR